jgi:hypothetical protein
MAVTRKGQVDSVIHVYGEVTILLNFGLYGIFPASCQFRTGSGSVLYLQILRIGIGDEIPVQRLLVTLLFVGEL